MEIIFPYEKKREQQDKLIEDIENAVKNKKNILIHAPTGLGKTISSLFPALNYALKNKLTVFFLTSRHTQHKIAIDTLKAIKEKSDIKFKVIDLIGKRHMCLQPGIETLSSSEFSEYCKDQTEKDLCNFYMNVKSNSKLSFETESAIKEINSKISDVEEVKNICEKNKICPYEASCILGQKADVIICDYNHLLNPSIRENLLERINKDLGNSIVIIDEAHNLPDRIRNILSEQISTLVIDYAIKETSFNPYISDKLKELKKVLETLAQKISIEDSEALIKKEEFIQLVSNIGFYEELTNELKLISDVVLEEKKKSFSSPIARFLASWTGPDKSFARILTKGFTKKGSPNITLTYRCLDPSLILKPLSEKTHSLILMSGTLSPVNMYKDLFNIDCITQEYKSPFPKDNKLSLIVPDITTKFTARNSLMYKMIAEHCAKIVNIIPGNSILFFPSYDMRDEINVVFQNLCEKTTLMESKNLTKEEKSQILEKFKSYKNVGSCLLAASSGSFGESIDLLGDLLKCVIVIGLPLSRPNLETKELIKYYDLKYAKGWDYGYIMPAIIKSLQNAGRCIRSETDRGVVVYLDQRYTWDNYFKCFPKDEKIIVTKEPLEKIKEFFK